VWTSAYASSVAPQACAPRSQACSSDMSWAHRPATESRGGPAGVPEPRHVGYDHVERVGGIGTVRGLGAGLDTGHVAHPGARTTPDTGV